MSLDRKPSPELYLPYNGAPAPTTALCRYKHCVPNEDRAMISIRHDVRTTMKQT